MALHLLRQKCWWRVRWRLAAGELSSVRLSSRVSCRVGVSKGQQSSTWHMLLQPARPSCIWMIPIRVLADHAPPMLSAACHAASAVHLAKQLHARCELQDATTAPTSVLHLLEEKQPGCGVSHALVSDAFIARNCLQAHLQEQEALECLQCADSQMSAPHAPAKHADI